MRERFVRHQGQTGHVYTPPSAPGRRFAPLLRVDVYTTPEGHTVLRPAGDLESASVPLFRQAVADIGPGEQVVICLEQVPFVDSSGIGALIGAVRRVRQLGGSVVVASPRSSVGRVLHLTGVDRVVDMAESMDEAIAALVSAGIPADTGQAVAI